ncbi:sigma 54-interacting transcriptional regulator [Desulfitobacterium sp. PCE1]|uniref:sigma 54-interacting transcriptional regulator n=1 Tax=Desulfitobacterium sp. PCE1 TaxID=146907 RepID=UPI000A00352B
MFTTPTRTAFTGAESKGRQVKIELAMNGTLFLDEIGDMPLEIQPTFLRVLEDKKVMRLGSNKDVQVDFRLIAATNCDLHQLVQEKKFCADLYYRLGILELALPPFVSEAETFYYSPIILLRGFVKKQDAHRSN